MRFTGMLHANGFNREEKEGGAKPAKDVQK